MKEYNPFNWYWKVGSDTNRVFSSAVGDYVPTSNATYVTWIADGTKATNIDTEANLGDVLANFAIRPTTPGVLDNYLNQQSQRISLEVMFKIVFSLMNEIRVLKGQAPITPAQARAHIKANFL